MRRLYNVALIMLTLSIVGTASASDLPAPNTQPSFPIRAAFYYPWFPAAWRQQGLDPYTHWQPSLGRYSSTDPTLIRQHIAMLQYAKVQAGIASWWGPGDN